MTPVRTFDRTLLGLFARAALAAFAASALWVTPAAAGSAVLEAMIDIHRLSSSPGLGSWEGGPDRAEAAPQGSPSPRWTMVAGANAAESACAPLLRHSFTPIQGGNAHSLCRYQGKVLLVVNTASQCGFTYQYEGLEALYRKYRDKGLVVVGFPSNDFGGQEPGTNKEIAEFCRTKYGVQFPMYEKVSVTRLDDNPLYADLAAKTGAKPRWNFHKYLIDRSGERVQSYASAVEPGSREFEGAIERLLAERPATRRS
jgi:glutathione peroxidase